VRKWHCAYLVDKRILWLVGCLGFEPRLAICREQKHATIQARRCDRHSWGGGSGSVPRLCINLGPGTCLTTEENHGKTSGCPKSARLISAEHDSFGRLGHRLALSSAGLLAPVAFGLHLGRQGQPSASLSICRVAELRCSPRQLTLSRSSQSGL
jgi:hypothetical protein